MKSEMGAPPRRRGEPLLALLLIAASWTAGRFLLWEPPFAEVIGGGPVWGQRGNPGELSRELWTVQEARRTPMISQGPVAALPSAPAASTAGQARPATPAANIPLALAGGTAVEAPPEVAGRIEASPPERPPARPAVPPKPVRHGRWHVDAWLAWRHGSGSPRIANGARAPSYGGTQAGIVAQYDLAEGAYRPALHLRATYAPERPRQAELGLGAGLRPLASLPVRVLVEGRITRTEARSAVRPAALAVTEFPRVRLPLGLTGEGYAQGGWVGGRDATAFADGQARVTHDLRLAARARVKLGLGTWGGAQKFAGRLDVGPTATADLGPLRVAVDYRVRIAGRAAPGNGLAVTVSTGF